MCVCVCVFLKLTFLFHKDALKGEVNPYFFKILHRRKENNTVSGQTILVFYKNKYYVNIASVHYFDT